MNVFPIGTPVTLEGDIKGTITAILIYEYGTQYEVVWWNGRERKKDWIYDKEVQRCDEAKSVRLGFK
jgi:hypothetical protein